MGKFDLVVTSDLPRAFETALAMGYAVDRQEKLLSEIGEGVEDEVDWTLGCAGFARAARLAGATAKACAAQATFLRSIALALRATGPSPGRVTRRDRLKRESSVCCLNTTSASGVQPRAVRGRAHSLRRHHLCWRRSLAPATRLAMRRRGDGSAARCGRRRGENDWPTNYPCAHGGARLPARKPKGARRRPLTTDN